MTKETKKRSKILAYALIIIGLLILIIPQFSAAASVAVELLLGWILTLGAAAQVALLMMSKEKNDIAVWIIAIALLVIGLYFLFNPLSAAALMTWLFAGLAFISGISSVIQGFYQQGNVTKLLIANGIIGIVNQPFPLCFAIIQRKTNGGRALINCFA